MNDQAVTSYQSPAVLRFFAKLVSYVFHPLFIPTYVFLTLSLLFPTDFQVTQRPFKIQLISIFWMSAFFPAFATFLLWKLKFAESILLKTQKERIAPYIITMVFYWWLWYLSKNFTDQPFVLRAFFLGVFLTTPPALVINNFIKISMHAIAVGSAAMFMIVVAFFYGTQLTLPISVAIFIGGLVCTSRLVISDHTNKEIYLGFGLGVICQLIAAWFTF
jgi:hypothetical protein